MFDDDHPNVIATILRVGKGRALVPAKPLGTAPGIGTSARRASIFRPAIGNGAEALGEPNLRRCIGIGGAFETRITGVTTTRK
jgi:hypothetical protein